MRVLLDTNAYSGMRNDHPGVLALIRRSSEVLIPAIVAGELIAGFRNGNRLAENSAELRSFLAEAKVHQVPVTWSTADRYGRIYASLRRKGTPIPSNDMWIAAHAMETGADLISFDRHFGEVDGLVWIHPERPEL